MKTMKIATYLALSLGVDMEKLKDDLTAQWQNGVKPNAKYPVIHQGKKERERRLKRMKKESEKL